MLSASDASVLSADLLRLPLREGDDGTSERYVLQLPEKPQLPVFSLVQMDLIACIPALLKLSGFHRLHRH